jgi:hypothetical protein
MKQIVNHLVSFATYETLLHNNIPDHPLKLEEKT